MEETKHMIILYRECLLKQQQTDALLSYEMQWSAYWWSANTEMRGQRHHGKKLNQELSDVRAFITISNEQMGHQLTK